MGLTMNQEKIMKWAIIIGLWIVVGLLLYPLLVLDDMADFNLNSYLFRSTIGIVIMIIMLGRNVFDLFMPQAYSQKVSNIRTALLVIYSFLITGGIIFMISRLIKLYISTLGNDVSI